jgi:pimeloyl-ACP methyl ester carboxylesterase
MKLKLHILFLLISIGLLSFSVAAQQDKFADYGAVKIHYRDQGKGKNALIFIHGWACSLDFWKKQFDGVSNYRAIYIDLPGHGKSDKPQTAYTMEYFARAIEAVMHDAGVKKAVLVGHSMGTPVVRNFYKLYPDQTLGLVMVDGSLRPFGKKEQGQQFLGMLKANYKQTAAGMIETMFGPTMPADLKSEIRSAMQATPENVALSAMESLFDDKSYPQEKISVPVMVILADNGNWPPDTEEYLRSVTTTLKVHKWQGVGHFLMMEKPEVFNQSMGIFITSNHLL